MTRTFLTAALVPLAALLLGCPHDLTRRQWPDQQAPPDQGVDLPRDRGAPDLRDAGTADVGSDLRPDAGCKPRCVTTLAGKGFPGSNATTVPLSQAEFTTPGDVAVDKWDNVFVADTGNHVIRQISGGKVSVLAGGVNQPGFVDGAGATARFYRPRGVAVDGNGVVYVADHYNHSLRRISKGVVSTVAGDTKSGYVDGHISVARFYYPKGVTLDASGKKIYVAERGNNRVRIIEDELVKTLAGNSFTCGYLDGKALVAQFCKPTDVAVYKDEVFVVEEGDHVRKIALGLVTSLARNEVSGYANGVGVQARFNNPDGVAVSPTGDVVVADQHNHAIRLVTPAGAVTTIAGNGWGGYINGGSDVAQFNMPMGVAVDAKGVIYVADSQNHAIRIIK